MITLPIGIVTTFLVLILSMGSGTFGMYLQLHSILIVIGGTITLLLFTTPSSVLKTLYHFFKDLFQKEDFFAEYQKELIQLTRDRSLPLTTHHPLISYASELWDQGVDPDLFVALLSQKKQELETQPVEALQALKNLAKYPPALGMAGTVMGMISLFSQLDQKRDTIGQSLAVAMTATFFGLLMTNMVISPLADRLHLRHIKTQRLLNDIYQILLLINRNEASVLITGEMETRQVATA